MSLLHRLGTTRARLAWWLFVAALSAFVLFVLWAFVGTFVLGLFLYYASRPAYWRVRSVVPSDGLAALVTILVSAVPILALFVYTGVRVLTDLARATDVGPADVADFVAQYVIGGDLSGSGEEVLTTVLQDPTRLNEVSTDLVANLLTGGLQTLGVVTGVLVHLGLAFALAFTLLRDDDDIAAWAREYVASEGSTALAYGTAVDQDLQTVYFGNVLFVFAVAGIATVVYHGFNFVAPSALTIPAPTLLALLTGVTSLVPLLVGKLVYLPIVAYLGVQAAEGTGSELFVYPVGLLVVSFLVLDILPQTFLQPYLAGRTIGTELMMFAYILGPLLFGWYGFFLLPLLLVLVVQTVRIVVVELVHGDRLTPAVTDAESMGADPPRREPPPWSRAARSGQSAPVTDDADDDEVGAEGSDENGANGDGSHEDGDEGGTNDDGNGSNGDDGRENDTAGDGDDRQ